ncbi:GlmL-related ornithine degradation protein [Youngiibacter fragilis]|uniref:Reactivating factor for adenosylcobalamine-dependent D-ornithine aminomutase n=1 Tax=Youngiibacter fragilis 232.1 TaxID=994573 RepID=V7I2K9_9CLOT|nr:GlmL-related ornithine degradation protein [Youngiibacter fragilis]ETA79429.1 reactivating factor for adenosylcobalamine-dependent D-ornithine aminomutase [Youngiibacter fragilis 232.1]
MECDVLVAEIGSTTTKVNAFSKIDGIWCFLGQGQGTTTVADGDVTVGLKCAADDLCRRLGCNEITGREFLASSSAAGGLRMTVHGLVRDMTVKAAREAALGAGANVSLVTSGKLRKSDIEKVRAISPNIIMIAGGLDYGERETALHNAMMISESGLKAPVVYAGNIENQGEIKSILKDYGGKVYLVDNVYPRVDELNVEPARRVIQKVFEEHIVEAPGMHKVRKLINGRIMPTPGAVMEAAKLLHEYLGDLMVIDVGGATTDVHSVAEGSEEISRILIAPEPLAKRTVEGDLGVYVNRWNLAELIGTDELEREFGEGAGDLVSHLRPIPSDGNELRMAARLADKAVEVSVRRHAGVRRHLYGEAGGRQDVAEGKDLTAVRHIIGTGGALTRLPGGKDILERIQRFGRGGELLPKNECQVHLDIMYIMSSVGVMAGSHREGALELLRWSLGI